MARPGEIAAALNLDDPQNRCYACSIHNDEGLHLRFTQVGEHTVECRWTPEPHLCGAPDVLHGGVQAVLLDETMGYGVRTMVGRDANLVTTQFELRYRRPVLMTRSLVVRATADRFDTPNAFVSGAILPADGNDEAVLTEATARWRLLS